MVNKTKTKIHKTRIFIGSYRSFCVIKPRILVSQREFFYTDLICLDGVRTARDAIAAVNSSLADNALNLEAVIPIEQTIPLWLVRLAFRLTEKTKLSFNIDFAPFTVFDIYRVLLIYAASFRQ